jgi:UDP-glucose 4-epimerase
VGAGFAQVSFRVVEYFLMNILVTGGAGFIGSHLCEYLVDAGHRVIVVDDLSTGDKLNLQRVVDVIDFYEEKIEFFDFDKLTKIDAVVHLAAQVSVPVSINDFGRSSSSNLLGAIKVIDFCRVNQVPLVFASSSALYGNLELGDDTDAVVDVLSPYAADKYVLELYAKVAYQLYSLSSIALRFYNVYGPRQDPSSAYSGVISIFSDRLLRGQDITINGGFQSRDFIYVEDVVKAIYQSVLTVQERLLCEQINVLTGQSITIDRVADMLIAAVGTEVEKIYKELPAGDPKRSKGTTVKMRHLLGTDLNDMVPIDAGLLSTVNFIRD